MIYIVYFILLSLLLKHEADSTEEKTIVRYLIPAIYIILIGFRGANVGVDTPVYYQHYYLFGEFGCDFVEQGFDWINRTFYALGLGSWSLFLICAILTIIPVAYTLNKLPKREYIVAAILFYSSSFALICNGMRQAVVCGVFLMIASFFFEYDEEEVSVRTVVLYIVSLCLFSLIHASALLLLPLFLLYKIKLSQNLYILIYIISFSFVFIDLSSLIPTFEIGNRDYSRFVEGELKQASWLGFTISSTLNIIIFVSMIKCDFHNRFPMLFNLVLLSFFFKNVGFNFPFVSRITMYFSWFLYLAVGKLYIEDDDYGSLTYNGVSFMRVTFLIFFALLVNTFVSQDNRLNPYTFYWENSNYKQYIK